MVMYDDLEPGNFVESTQYPKTTRRTIDVSNLITESYDYIDLDYTGNDLTTVTYKTGGASGTTVATLALTYTAGVLQTITRT